jgi:hypothetical protein
MIRNQTSQAWEVLVGHSGPNPCTCSEPSQGLKHPWIIAILCPRSWRPDQADEAYKVRDNVSGA